MSEAYRLEISLSEGEMYRLMFAISNQIYQAKEELSNDEINDSAKFREREYGALHNRIRKALLLGRVE